MNLHIIGVNHTTAPLSIREQITIVAEEIPATLLYLQQTGLVEELVLLATCNRCEFIAICEDPQVLINWLLNKGEGNILQSYLYHYQNKQAIQHLLQVSVGLNSMIMGEKEIFGQLKRAYEWSLTCGTVGKNFHHLFPAVFAFAKQIRQRTALDEKSVSVAYSAITLARQIFADLTQLTVLLIGAGETIELAARHLKEHGVHKIIVANRTFSKAEILAGHFKGVAISLYDIADYLFKADIVLTATASPIPLLGKGMVESALHKRKHRATLMIDVAVPRNIEPEVGKLNNIYLYNMDDLQKIVENNLKIRKNCAQEADSLVKLYADHYVKQWQALDSVVIIKAYRNKMEKVRDEVLQQAKQMLKRGSTVEATLEFLAHTLTKKLMHEPSVQIRQASYEGKKEIINTVRTLFDLEVIEQ